MGVLRSIGRYQLQALIGSGAMGEIYEAHDPAIERRVAIKLLRPDLIAQSGDDAGWLERFRQEARAAGRLLHPNIVALLDYGEEAGTPFLAMEFVEGASLDEVLKQRARLPEWEALAIMAQILSALEFAHANGVVHRDVKPGNILLTKAGLVKITDFGIARLESSDLTLAGDVLGTPSYMAPEQLAGRTADCRADLFAAGAVLFELLTGQRPFGKGLAEVVLNMERRGPADICALNAEINPALKPVIETALALSPEQRYPSAAQFSRAIAAAQARSAPPPPGLPEATAAGGKETVISPAGAPRLPAGPTHPAGDASLGTELLIEVERDLAAVIGPLARILVRRGAKTVRSLAELYETVAAHIDDEVDRARFLENGAARVQQLRSQSPASRSGTSTAGQGPPTFARPSGINPEALRRLELALTRYIGPIARILIRDQLSKSGSVAHLYHDLAVHIPNERDRASFLASGRSE